jgi:hypothetical protein
LERAKNVRIEERIWAMDRLAHGERLEHPNDVTPGHARMFFRDFKARRG